MNNSLPQYCIRITARILVSIGVFLTGFAILATITYASSVKLPVISKADWSAKKSTLSMQGQNWGSGQIVIVSNALTREIISSVTANTKGKWKLTITNPASVPCRVRVESGIRFDERDLKNAPAACSADPFTHVFAFNNLGMHCYDRDYSIFSILPLFNVVNAQVVRKGAAGSKPVILDATQANVFYSAVADNTHSINRTSLNKTNFWDYAQQLFGLPTPLPADEGLLGAKMPGLANAPQAFSAFDPAQKWFTAAGIPITDWDDNLQKNSYPLMSIQVFDIGTLSSPPPTFVVVPVSDEMHCSDCHATNGIAANAATKTKYAIARDWSSNADAELQYRENILILHDGKEKTTPALMDSKPVLCASCHYSPALDLGGVGPQGDQIGKPMLSMAIHGRHGKDMTGNIPGPGTPPIIPDTGIATCYHCHPGNITQCLRGAMGSAGLICQNCHGGLLAVSGEYASRMPWLDEPKCQSCHTGDAVDHLGNSIRGNIAFNPADQTAAPIIATNKRFAEEDNTLYRNSLGHSGIACEACHGSTHAEWPVADPNSNDNIAAIQLQGHSGPIIECTACHADGPPLSLNGPHGLHNINDKNWNTNHKHFYEQYPSACKACHGVALEGTVLSLAAAKRTLIADDKKTKSVSKGTPVSCSLCHGNPLSGGN